MKDDVLFGYLGNLSMEDYIDEARVKQVKEKIASLDKTGNIILFGYGSSTIITPDILVYADMPRWEIQQRMRKNEVTGLGIDNREDPFQYNINAVILMIGMYWTNIKKLYEKVDYWLDTVGRNQNN